MPINDQIYRRPHSRPILPALPVIRLQPDPVEGGGEIGWHLGQLDPGQLAEAGARTATQEVSQLVTPSSPSSTPSGPSTGPPNQCVRIWTAGGILNRCFDANGIMTSEWIGDMRPSEAFLPRSMVAPTSALEYGTLAPVARTAYTLAPRPSFGPTPSAVPSAGMQLAPGAPRAPAPGQEPYTPSGYGGQMPGGTDEVYYPPPSRPGEIQYGPVTSPYEYD